MTQLIYHLVPRSDFTRSCRDGVYRPESLAREGFVHCADERSALAIAADYFSATEGDLLLLQVDLSQLSAETIFEAPAPIAGGGTAHLELAASFPHVYGPIELDAIVGVGVLSMRSQGYCWPSKFVPLSAVLSNG